jgi:hypothetical protein
VAGELYNSTPYASVLDHGQHFTVGFLGEMGLGSTVVEIEAHVNQLVSLMTSLLLSPCEN